MCEFISFFHTPFPEELAISILDLNSHANTEKKLKLNLNLWREGHYLPNGELILRLNPSDNFDQIELENKFKNQFPTFISFFNYCGEKLPESIVEGIEFLDLRGLTSAKGLKLVEGIKFLDLSGLTSAEGLKLVKGIKSLYLSGLIEK